MPFFWGWLLSGGEGLSRDTSKGAPTDAEGHRGPSASSGVSRGLPSTGTTTRGAQEAERGPQGAPVSSPPQHMAGER